MTTLDTEPTGSVQPSDAAAAEEIERLTRDCENKDLSIMVLKQQLEESERQRKILAEYIESLGKGGIEAATGAGK